MGKPAFSILLRVWHTFFVVVFYLMKIKLLNVKKKFFNECKQKSVVLPRCQVHLGSHQTPLGRSHGNVGRLGSVEAAGTDEG